MKNKDRDYELLGTLLVWLWVSWPFVRPGNYVYGFDTLAYTGPALQETFDSWRSLRVPLWSDEIFGGVPFLGRLGAQGIYFPNLLFSFFTLNDALDLIVAFHLLILAVGVLTLVRKGLMLPAPSGSLSAVAVMTSGVVAIKSLSLDQLVAIAWLPWILYFLERIINSADKRKFVPGLVLSASFLILGGHPQYIYMFVLFSIIYGGVKIIEKRQYRALAPLLVSSIFVLGICSLQLVSTYLLNKSSVMSGKKSLESLANPSYVLHPSRIVSGIIGDPLSKEAYQVAGASEALGGLNVLIVCLAIVGLYELWNRKSFLFGLLLSTVSIISVLVAIGPQWVFFRFMYEIIPGFGNARVPSRFIVCSVFALMVLSAYGINYVFHGIREGRIQLFLFVSSIILFVPVMIKSQLSESQLLLIIISALFVLSLLQIRNLQVRRFLSLVGLAPLLIVPTLASQVNSPSRQHSFNQPFESATNSIVDFLKENDGLTLALTYDRFDNANYLVNTLRPNTNALHGIRLKDGYDGGMWVQERWVEQVKSLTGGQFDNNLTIRSQVKFPVDAETAASMGIRWAYIETEVLDAATQLKGWTGPILKEGTLELWENPMWRGTATLYYETSLIDANVSFKKPKVAAVEKSEFLLECEEDCEPFGPTYFSRGDATSSFEVTVSKTSVATLDVSWSSDWKVYVNGIRKNPLPVNSNQLGIHLEPGNNKVTVVFAPTWFLPLVGLSVLTLIGLALYILVNYCVDQNSRKRWS